MRRLLSKPLTEWDLEFADLTRAYHRMLYVVAVLDEPLSPREIRYLLIARWQSNSDEASVRHRIALGVEQAELRWRPGDRYSLTPTGVNHLAQIAGRIRERRAGARVRPGRRERGGGARAGSTARSGGTGGPPGRGRDARGGRDRRSGGRRGPSGR